MESSCFAKDGARADVPFSRLDPLPSRDQDKRSSPSPSLSSETVASNEAVTPFAWVHDHEAVNQWLRSIPVDERADFALRIAANIETIQKSHLANLERGCEDSILSYAILVEYAQHLGISPMEVCWVLNQEAEKNVDSLLGARVDRMLADASSRRALPRRRGDDAASPLYMNRPGLDAHWKAVGRTSSHRRGSDRARNRYNGEAVAFSTSDAGRAG